jgi:hypothetical protein
MMFQLKSLIIKHIFERIEEKYFLKTGTSGNSVSVSKIAEFAEFNVAVRSLCLATARVLASSHTCKPVASRYSASLYVNRCGAQYMRERNAV